MVLWYNTDKLIENFKDRKKSYGTLLNLPIDSLLFLFIFFSMFFVLIHDYNLCFTGFPYCIFSYCKFSYYNYISIWPYYIVIHFTWYHLLNICDILILLWTSNKLTAWIELILLNFEFSSRDIDATDLMFTWTSPEIFQTVPLWTPYIKMLPKLLASYVISCIISCTDVYCLYHTWHHSYMLCYLLHMCAIST